MSVIHGFIKRSELYYSLWPFVVAMPTLMTGRRKEFHNCPDSELTLLLDSIADTRVNT